MAAGPTGLRREGKADERVLTPAEKEAERQRLEKEAFEEAAQQIKQAVRSDPAMADLAKQL